MMTVSTLVSAWPRRLMAVVPSVPERVRTGRSHEWSVTDVREQLEAIPAARASAAGPEVIGLLKREREAREAHLVEVEEG